MAKHHPLRAFSQLEGAVTEIQEELIFHTDVLLAAGVGPWEMHRHADGLYLSDEWQDIFRIERPTDRFREYLGLFESNSQKSFLEQIEAVFTNGIDSVLEFRHKLDGRTVLTRGRVVAPGRMVGADLLL